ncbi:MAG: hypothetical protein MZW92_47345 [Comamonadaceae bacterium]|nr:hypothetical protein [Comamonadaceae bacterium]
MDAAMTQSTTTGFTDDAAHRHFWSAHPGMASRMIRTRARVVPRLGGLGTEPDMDWSEQVLMLLGLCEEYQSSAVGMAHLRAAIRREPCLGTVLQASLIEMRYANQSIRQEVLGFLEKLSRHIKDSVPDVDGSR